jgi:hypothetical protein
MNFIEKIVQYSIKFSPYVLIQKHGKRHCGWGDLNLGNKTNKQPQVMMGGTSPFHIT